MSESKMISWLGSEDMSLDTHTIKTCGEITLGYYGGNTENGACKNEDGALVLCSRDNGWKFALLLDAHATSESARLVLETVKRQRHLCEVLTGDSDEGIAGKCSCSMLQTSRC